MTLADRCGDWSLRHPVAVLGAFASAGGATLGYGEAGLWGAAVGLCAGVGLSYLVAHIEPRDPPLGPHQ